MCMWCSRCAIQCFSRLVPGLVALSPCWTQQDMLILANAMMYTRLAPNGSYGSALYFNSLARHWKPVVSSHHGMSSVSVSEI